jgi:hypothetical protein
MKSWHRAIGSERKSPDIFYSGNNCKNRIKFNNPEAVF